MRRFGFAVGCLVAILTMVQAGIVLATVIVESDDTWLRQKSPDNCYHGDTAISVWAKDSPGEGSWRNGDLQFDLSGVGAQITDAKLELYSTTSADTSGAFHQVAKLVSPSPSTATFDAWTYNSYASGIGSSYTVTQFESFGSYTLPAGSPASTWYDSNAASLADLSLLEGVRTGSNKVLTLSMESETVSDGIRDWGGLNTSGNFAARLIVTTAPEPSTIVLLAASLISLLAYGWRKRR
jgi:hypothetical protein